jgi:hypothetical protein
MSVYGPGTVALSGRPVSDRASVNSSTMPSPAGAVMRSTTSNGVLVSQCGWPSLRGSSMVRMPRRWS